MMGCAHCTCQEARLPESKLSPREHQVSTAGMFMELVKSATWTASLVTRWWWWSVGGLAQVCDMATDQEHRPMTKFR